MIWVFKKEIVDRAQRRMTLSLFVFFLFVPVLLLLVGMSIQASKSPELPITSRLPHSIHDFTFSLLFLLLMDCLADINPVSTATIDKASFIMQAFSTKATACSRNRS